MRFALLQPNWNFAGSTYFGCRETHLPLELLFARQQLEAAGHETRLLDAHLEGLSLADAAPRLAAFRPDVVVVTTAPTYLFWRCPQPELRLPALWLRHVRGSARTVAVGPHASATPLATLRKLDCDLVLRGEPDCALAALAVADWNDVPGGVPRAALAPPGPTRPLAAPLETDMRGLAALDFHAYPLHLRRHRHHVFSGQGRGAEVEVSRGCPWNCTFCNKTLFRNRFRERPLAAVLREIEALLAAGFDYLYFIDEIFGCGRATPALLEALAQLPLTFGMQTRIDLWDEAGLAALGRAHCVSLECGLESVTPEGRERFRKGCRLDNDRLGALLREARRHIPWVQANLIANPDDDLDAIAAWRRDLIAAGIWASQPVPVFAFPGSPLYRHMFGEPDDNAWERAHRHYLAVNNRRRYYSDIQDQSPASLAPLESLKTP